jgi:hypothetical protein
MRASHRGPEGWTVEDQDSALGHLGHEVEEFDVVAVKAIGVVKGDRANLPDGRGPDALH